MMENICVMGLGYIGLPTASLLATKGFKVHGVDVNSDIPAAINRGEVQIHEPDLDILVKAAVQSGNLYASLEPAPADVFIIAVPTPFRDNHVPDISYVEAATKAIAPYLEAGNLVVIESTIPVGTTEKVGQILQELRPDLDIPERQVLNISGSDSKNSVYIAHCPERVLPGQILRELVDNDRVIGGLNARSSIAAQDFYKRFVKGEVLTTEVRTAELCKLTENSFRDVNIAFANELSIIAEKLDIDVWELIRLANRHPRVNILEPGPGVGGHCIAVDPWFIVDSVPNEARLIKTARDINDSKPHYVLDKIKHQTAKMIDPVIACLGLAFKANIDDLRESPAMEIVQELAAAGLGKLLVVEPHLSKLPAEFEKYSHIEFTDYETAVKNADLIVLLVNHDLFKNINRRLLDEKIVIDTRGIWR